MRLLPASAIAVSLGVLLTAGSPTPAPRCDTVRMLPPSIGRQTGIALVRPTRDTLVTGRHHPEEPLDTTPWSREPPIVGRRYTVLRAAGVDAWHGVDPATIQDVILVPWAVSAGCGTMRGSTHLTDSAMASPALVTIWPRPRGLWINDVPVADIEFSLMSWQPEWPSTRPEPLQDLFEVYAHLPTYQALGIGGKDSAAPYVAWTKAHLEVFPGNAQLLHLWAVESRDLVAFTQQDPELHAGLTPAAVFIPFDRPYPGQVHAPGIISRDASGRSSLAIAWDLDHDGQFDLYLHGVQRSP